MYNTARNKSFSFKHFFVALLSAALLVISLGAAVRTGGTGLAVEYGEIEGFGSIVVNGVHYDERAANIIINGAANQPHHLLKLGMIVEVQGTVDATRVAGIADVVIANRSLIGQVQSVDATTGEFTVLNQRIRSSSSVQTEGISNGGRVEPGLWVGIYGLRNESSNGFVATRLEGIDTPGDSLIRGGVSAVTPTQFRIGALNVNRVGAITTDTDGVVDGAFVEVTGTFDAALGTLNAATIKVTREVHGAEGADTELSGFVADFQSAAIFMLSGIQVDASGARFGNGSPAALANGRKIEVEGHFMGGVLHASEIQFKDLAPSTTSTNRQRSVELEGRISSYRSPLDFTLQGYTIDASRAAIKISLGTSPGAGVRAHVKGALIDGVVKAASVEYASR